jgi:hypothetical protein
MRVKEGKWDKNIRFYMVSRLLPLQHSSVIMRGYIFRNSSGVRDGQRARKERLIGIVVLCWPTIASMM